MYQCSHCYRTMSEPHDKCPYCGVILAYIQCNNCGHTGGKNEFVSNGNRCPKCNAGVFIPGQVQPAAHPQPKKVTCPFCGTENLEQADSCKQCGKPRPMIVGANKLKSTARRFLISGILNIISGLCIATALGFTLIFPIPFGILVMLLGIWEVVNAYFFWYTPPKTAWNAKHIAFLELAAFLCGPIWNLLFGIGNLMSLGDPNVKTYLDDLYKADPLKPKKANRLLTGWMSTGMGGLAALGGAVILILFVLAQAADSAQDNAQGFVLSTALCPVPLLLVGLVLIGAGVYSLWTVKNLR